MCITNLQLATLGHYDVFQTNSDIERYNAYNAVIPNCTTLQPQSVHMFYIFVLNKSLRGKNSAFGQGGLNSPDAQRVNMHARAQ